MILVLVLLYVYWSTYFVLCCKLFIYVSFSELRTSAGGRESYFFLLLLSCNNVVTVRRSFGFLLVLRIGCVILYWHFLCLQYNSIGLVNQIIFKRIHFSYFAFSCLILSLFHALFFLHVSLNCHRNSRSHMRKDQPEFQQLVFKNDIIILPLKR